MKDKTIKDTLFKIKISDLLHESGKEDQLVFEHKFSPQLTNLHDEGIGWIFTFQSLDSTSLLGTLTDVTACFHEVCDSCETSFIRSVYIPSYVARFVFEDDTTKQEANESEEVIFFINKKAETIDIEDMIVQSILLNDPFVKRCADCTKRLADMDDDDEVFDDFASKGNVLFH